MAANAWYGQMGSFTPDGGNSSSGQNKPNGDGNMPPPPNPYQHGQMPGHPAPWVGFGQDLDYSNLGDGFAQAWDTTLQGLNDSGAGAMQDLTGLSIMTNDPLFSQMMGDFPGPDIFQF
ncbi:hypothetical protein M406DRAFT_357531 [Cryphonectria parasitica EP155]|uniref:Uncharacterized protein n=1 Tax=Cryphonectria parasitica (strain ATCC 38755 / EP155) TaxID=660469 RepID=A0A9P4XXJ7_CRYP1|nr:uncharacterized protein M406DRAFT_357531 [Cryphonectria parasitica EP155]KAF3762610.1 hypothetical protein M406DRAFT_357531 [Cryphonectria parasitica EP155]